MKAAIVIGSDSDWPIMKPAVETLKKFGVEASGARRARVYRGGGRRGAFGRRIGQPHDAPRHRRSCQCDAAKRHGCAFGDGTDAVGDPRGGDGDQRRKERGLVCRTDLGARG